jgi:galactose mutarotase-like enzyme
MELTDNEATLSHYPFEFSLRLTYRLAGGQLFWEQRVVNRSPEPLPFSTGFHPYFAVPLTPRGLRSECFAEIPDCRRLTMHGRGEQFTAKPFPGQNWSVAEDVSMTLFLTDLKRRELILADPLSELEVVLNWQEAPTFRFVAIWSKSTEAPFYCLEPWTAVSNPFTRAKDRELVVLEPGATFDAAFRMELRETP